MAECGRGLRISRGAALAEFVVVLPVMLALGLGVIQCLQFYQAKSVLNYATFEAARKGATTHAQAAPMLDELGMRMAPVFGGDGSPETLNAAILEGMREAKNPLVTRLQVVSPSAEAFQDFGINNAETGQLEIPNDHLKYRDHKKLGTHSGINIQDANLLTIRTSYGYKLDVPFVGGLLSRVLAVFDPANAGLYEQGRMPMRATATVRMQSAARQSSAVQRETPNFASNNRAGPSGQGSPFTPDNRLGGGAACNPARQSCVSNGLNQGNPNSCTPPVIAAGQGQTSGSANLPALSVGNPIHIGSGNKYQVETDLQLGSENGITLLWQRHYNSQRDNQNTLGKGWSHSYEIQALRTEQGVVLRQADGREIRFEQARNGKLYSWFTTDGWVTLADESSHPIRWQRLGGETLKFKSSGQLASIELSGERQIDLQYDGKQRLHIVRDTNQRELLLRYYPNGRVQTVTASNGKRIDYAYDDRSNLILAINDADLERYYHYEDPADANNLTGISNAEGIRYASWSYDDQDRAISSEHAGGVNWLSIDYQGDKLRYVTNSEGKISTYRIDSRHEIAFVESITGPGCGTCGDADTQYRYNDKLALTGSQHADGSSQRNEYDGLGRLEAVYRTAAEGEERLVTQFAFDGDQRLPSRFSRPSINPDGLHSIELQRNQQGQITQITENGWSPDFSGGYLPMKRSTHYEYRNGQLFASDGPVPGDVDRVLYPQHRATRSHPAQHKNKSGPIAIAGSDLTLAYSAKNRLAIIRKPDGEEYARLQYDKLWRPAILQAGNKQSTVEYDAAGRLSQIKAPDGSRIHWQWSSESRLLMRKHLDAAGEIIDSSEWQYNADNQLQSQAHSKGLANGARQSTVNYQYDAYGRLDTFYDELGVSTGIEYNAQGLPSSFTRWQRSASEARSVLAYDVHGNIASISDPRGNKSYRAYDDFGNLLYRSNPDRGLTMYRYDALGNVTARVDESGVINQFSYDNNQQLSGIGLPGLAPTTRFQHDQQGRPLKREGLNEAVQYTYPSENKVQKTTRIKALQRSYQSSTSLNEQSLEWLMPSGAKVTIERESDGKHARIMLNGNEISHVTVDAQGRLQSLQHANAIGQRMQYNSSGQLQSLQLMQGEQSLSALQYRYSDRALLSAISAQRANVSDESIFEYDIAGRLINADINGKQYRWQYDLNGNRKQSAVGARVNNYAVAPRANRYTKIDNNRRQHATTGELLADGELRYRYTVGHRIAAVYRGKKLLAKYRYNSEGERISKTVYGKHAKTTYFLYEDKKVQAELDEQGNVQREYLYLGRRLLGFVEDKSFYPVALNHLGAPTSVYDQRGKRVWQAEYHPFGSAQILQQDIVLNLRLPGQYFDQESGQHYNYFRSYNPQSGRYLTSDPLGIQPGLNTYAYVKNDPLNRVDFLGLNDQAIHYYMTYFLAVVAGLPKDEALIMALAAQYVDNNHRTSPLPAWGNVKENLLGTWLDIAKDKTDALESYHFVLDYEVGNKGDRVSQKQGESDIDFALRRVRNPQSRQLDRLRNASLVYDIYCRADGRASSRETKAQLYGEYLHAFQDTFAHRDRNNRPYSLFGNSGNAPETFIGHIPLSLIGVLNSYRPDKTYNQIDVDHSGTELSGYRSSFRNEYAYNETRTLQMEKEVFEKIRRDFGVSSDISWQQLAGDGDAKVGLQNYGNMGNAWEGGKAPIYRPAEGIQGVLQRFNAYNENAHPGGEDEGLKAKVEILNEFLKVYKFDEIPKYDVSSGRKNRKDILGGVHLPDGLIGEW